jgi:hypothetical protein
MLTPYDEYPVHQAPYPFSYIPSTDVNWDDGYAFFLFNADARIFFGAGLRVSPNVDIVGGWAMLNVTGQQYTVRFNRTWRRLFELAIGPFRIEFVEPLRKIRLTLAQNASDLRFDVLWEGIGPAVLEEHHVAINRGRRSTDQSRYAQVGQGSGTITLRDTVYRVEPASWAGARDHSWGLYADRPPHAPHPRILPPRKPEGGPNRALRIWVLFRCGSYSGFYHLHETAQGLQCKMADVFGTPFAGEIHKGWQGDPVTLLHGRHALEYEAGTRILKSGVITLEDRDGGLWRQEISVVTPPWMPDTIGYTPGSWKDGGNFHTYHGSEELALEWDEFDFSRQPVRFKRYQATGAALQDAFGLGNSQKDPESGYELIHGYEYLVRMKMTSPDGEIFAGTAMFEHFIKGAYEPYGFE